MTLPPPAPGTHVNDLDKLGLATALAKARKSYREGGVPIGAALVYHGASCGDTANAAVLGCAHNQRIQKSSPTLHAEMAALEDAGRQRAAIYRNSTMVGVFPLPIRPWMTHRWVHTVYDAEVRALVTPPSSG